MSLEKQMSRFRDDMLGKMQEVMKASNKDMVKRLRSELTGMRIMT